MPSPLDTIPQTTQDFAPFKELLFTLIVTNKYQRVLETGTDVGDSTRIFSTALQATQGQLVTIDIKPPQAWVADWPIKNVQFLTGDSTKDLKLTQEIDLLFLDAHLPGGNGYDQVKAELATLGVWVRAGGKIVVDDIFHSEFGIGIQKAMVEFACHHQLVWSYYPQSHGLCILEVTHPLPHGGPDGKP